MATNTAASFTDLTGNGSAGPFNISFLYLSEAEVDVTVDGVLKTLGTHYTFTSASQITFTSGNEPANNAVIKFQRDTNVGSKKVDFNDGSVLTEVDLDNNANQLLFSMQEIVDGGSSASVTTSSTAPLSPSPGDLWWNDTDGDLHVYYDDTNSQQWVAVSSSGSGPSGGSGSGSSSGSGITDGDKGDITVSNSGETFTIDSGVILTDKIANDAITTTKIANDAITTTKVANDAITTTKVADDAITADKLANTNVTAGSYSNTNITVDAQGRITSATSGSGGSGSSGVSLVTGTSPIISSGGSTPAISISAASASAAGSMSASDYSKLLSLEQSATANFTPTGTGATARTLNTKLKEISSVKDYGATGDGSTDDSTAFSNAVKAADAINNIDGVEGTALPRADMCKVYVPAGTYNIANLVDTDNREVVYIIDQAAKFTSGSNNKLNGELVREGQFNINNYQHGSTDYSVTYAIRANVGSSTTLGGGDGVNAEILGVTAPNQLALYQDRDSVGLYVDNENALPLLNLSSVSSYAATSVTLTAAPSADVLKRYRKGMIIDTKHSTPYVGVVSSWSSNGQTINIQTGWYQYTSSGTAPSSTSTPSGTDGFAIGFKKVWAHNANVHIYNGGYAEKACGFELGIRNYKADSSNLFSNTANRVWGFDAVNLGGANDGAGNAGRHGQCGFIARTSTSNASWQHGFMAQNTVCGFTAYATVENPFQYTDSSGNVIYRVDNGGCLQLGQNAASSTVDRFIDFHSSTNNNDYDTRIISRGGNSNDGQGTLEIVAGTVEIRNKSLAIGDPEDTTTGVGSFIDFHSSGNNIDYDARLVCEGGSNTLGMGAYEIIAATVGVPKGAFIVGTNNATGNNTAQLTDSFIDFHSSGYDNDFDGRINSYGGGTGDGEAYMKLYGRAFGFVKGPSVTNDVVQWGILEDAGFYWLGHTSANLESTSVHAGVIMANGFATKAGIGSTTFNNAFNIHWTGTAANLYIDSALHGTISVSSDYRIKKDITTQTASGIDKIKQLRPVNYEFTDNTNFSFVADGVKREGFIAHEVAEVIPSAVDGEKDATNQIQSLRVDAIVSVLTKALQEAVGKIEVLEAKVTALENP